MTMRKHRSKHIFKCVVLFVDPFLPADGLCTFVPLFGWIKYGHKAHKESQGTRRLLQYELFNIIPH